MQAVDTLPGVTGPERPTKAMLTEARHIHPVQRPGVNVGIGALGTKY